MRLSFPTMLMLSLAVHVSVIGGVALYLFCDTSKTTALSSESAKPPTVTLIRSTEARVISQPQHSSIKSIKPSVATSSPVPAIPAPAKPLPVIAQTNHEANPNAHVQPLPPEAILSPNPAPNLNNADGVVFILDVSGSMYEPYAGSTRLAFAREVLSQRIRALKNGTPFAITLYAQRACTSGPLVAASDATREAAVRFIMREVDCGGGTNLPAGLTAAQKLHPGTFVLVSDGDLNISATNLSTQALGILGEKGQCAHLDVVGVAPRTQTGDEQLLESLADQQGGTYSVETMDGAAQLVTSAADSIKQSSANP